MTRETATKLLRDTLDSAKLNDWHIHLSTNAHDKFLGFCSHKDKCIILNAHHIDIHPDIEIINTIKHEIAHALTPGHQHDEIWANKAIELGCDNTNPCSNMSLTPEIIDAIRSGAQVEITFEEEMVRKAKYQITRLQDKCEYCGKIAKSIHETLIESKNETKPDKKLIRLECGHTLIKLIPKGTPFASLIADENDNKNCKHIWNKNTCQVCLTHRPFSFQTDGMRFIETALSINKGAAIFDEMGLGKTIQALGYIKFHPEALPVLYVVKSAIKFQWFKEILIWLGPEYMAQIISSSSDILIPKLKGYIISYDMLVHKERKSKNGKTIKQGFDISKFDGVIKTIILDECQQIKNPDSSRTQQVRRIVKNVNVIALSGTPWKNRGSEFFSVLNMMAPMKFHSYQGYIDRWVEKIFDGNKTKEGGIRRPEQFKEYIKDIAIRREIHEVMSELPDVNRTLFNCQLDDLSQSTYDDEVSDFVKWYNQFIIDGTEDSINSMNILAKLSRMRHITGLAKIPATIEFAEQFYEETDRKLTIFVHHKDVGEILFNELQSKFGKEIDVLKLTGEQSGEERFRIQELFKTSKRAFLVASTLASGEGINLQSCSDAIMHERQWNPQNEDQAAPGRFRRIGSTANVINVVFVTADDTVDSILHGIVERKRAAFHSSMNKGDAKNWNPNSLAVELADGIVKRWKEKNKNKPVSKLGELVKM